MTTERNVDAIELLLDDLFLAGDEVSRDEIYRHAERGHVPQGVTTYLRHLPDGDYTLDELVDEIDAGADATAENGTYGREARGQR